MEMDMSIFEAFEQNPDEDEEEIESFPVPRKKVKIESLEEDGSKEDGPVQDSTVSKITEFVGEDIFSDFVEIHRLPRIKVHKLDMVDFCVHEVAIPPHMEFTPLKQPTGKPAKEYKFTLDPFQKEAILCIENKQSVLVSAHTSAGKTVVAEYSIATSLRDQQKVVYTTPIKALSNQKYREFQEEFQDVGLVTGDVTININASCLVMTTEILRNMLYRGSEITRQVGWVVFDEIHYMRDKERGVVWEESLILLPDNVHYVFLSATIPNARQFVEWVAHLHNQPCHAVYTEYRPVPLQHYIFPAGGTGIHLVVDDKGQFQEQNFNASMNMLMNAGDAAKGDQKGRRGGFVGNTGESNIYKIVRMIMERHFAPVIVFSFSKKECETYALQMAKLDFNTETEKGLVDEVFNNAIQVLSEPDRKLPQVEYILPLLRRGIGIHHGGLLPILKETVEILFAEGLIKALFATETFAMGLNMPARTVLFTTPRKFDGKEFRWVTSGEYIQMSGRAGRRGIDDKGIVILMIDERIPPSTVRDIIQGSPDPIYSAFHLTYNMVLNLLRVDGINPEFMIERSFFQFQNQTAIPQLMTKFDQLMEECKNITIPDEPDVVSYCTIEKQMLSLKRDMQLFITKPQYLLPFMQPGRMVKIRNNEDIFDWGVIVTYKKLEKDMSRSKKQQDKAIKVDYVLEVLLYTEVPESEMEIEAKPCPKDKEGEMSVVPVLHNTVYEISSLRLHMPSDLKPKDNRKAVYLNVQEVKRRFKGKVPLLDPVKEMGIQETMFIDTCQQYKKYEERLLSHPIHQRKDVEFLSSLFEKKSQCTKEMKKVTDELKKAKSVLQLDELKCRKRVLRRLGFCSDQDIINIKGRVACELSSTDEILVTEMIFNGLFNDLTPEEAVTILSIFVCDEKSNEALKMSDTLSGLLRRIQDMARRIGQVSATAGLDIKEDAYVDQFKPFLMDVTYNWCKGCTFAELCQMTDIFEGSIIRSLRRLEEVLREMCQASKSMGNTDLEAKFSEGIKLIKRDIVFAASLYL